ncbi:beta-fructofuranosidase [Striga asiatica]|uniref:Beta-fructofuranosidase n=1 Tax=Striga asiatica TaxID=4170 RepID=A0A5A7PHH1_STRAF|nr:beta-fructofuranosidase [Striga asiatica]
MASKTQMSIPRNLLLDKSGQSKNSKSFVVETFRFEIPHLKGIELIDDPLIDPQLLCVRMNATVNGVFGPFGLFVLASKDLTEQTVVFFRIFKLRSSGKYVVLMCSDQSRYTVDHSIIESFGGKGKSCITARVYPKLAIFNNSHIYAFNKGKENVIISSLNAWSMKKAQIAQVHRRRKPSIS